MVTDPNTDNADDADDDSSVGPWLSGPIICRICGHQSISARPLCAPQTALQCSNCLNYSAEPDHDRAVELGMTTPHRSSDPSRPRRPGDSPDNPITAMWGRFLSAERLCDADGGPDRVVLHFEILPSDDAEDAAGGNMFSVAFVLADAEEMGVRLIEEAQGGGDEADDGVDDDDESADIDA